MNRPFKTIVLTFVLFLSVFTTDAQLSSRFYFGFKGGVNFSIPLVENEFSVFTETASPQGISKAYNQFTENLASQYSFLMFFRLFEMTYIGVNPGWYNYSYTYETEYFWTGDNSFSTRFEFNQKNSYLDIPLIIKQKFRKGKPLQPYIQLGAYYSILQQSNKEIKTFETESALNSSELELLQEIVPTKDIFLLSNAGAVAGLGLAYRFNRTEIAIETNFRYTVHNISNTNNRYENYRTLGKYYDVNDDLNLMNWSFSLVYLVGFKMPNKLNFCKP